MLKSLVKGAASLGDRVIANTLKPLTHPQTVDDRPPLTDDDERKFGQGSFRQLLAILRVNLTGSNEQSMRSNEESMRTKYLTYDKSTLTNLTEDFDMNCLGAGGWTVLNDQVYTDSKQNKPNKIAAMLDYKEVEESSCQSEDELTEDLRRLSQEVKTVEGEKESLSMQLKESLTKLDELSQTQPDINKRQCLLGPILEEKFSLEKVQTLKEKAVKYRIQTDDYMSEYRYRTDAKIRVLEGNIEKAEVEICKLDGLLEKIRLVLHKCQDMVASCPDLNKLLSFLDGQDISQ